MRTRILPLYAEGEYVPQFASFHDTDKLHILWSHRKNAKQYVVEVGRKEEAGITSVYVLFQEARSIFDTPSSVYAIEYKKLKELNFATLDAPQKGAGCKSGRCQGSVKLVGKGALPRFI